MQEYLIVELEILNQQCIDCGLEPYDLSTVKLITQLGCREDILKDAIENDQPLDFNKRYERSATKRLNNQRLL